MSDKEEKKAPPFEKLTFEGFKKAVRTELSDLAIARAGLSFDVRSPVLFFAWPREGAWFICLQDCPSANRWLVRSSRGKRYTSNTLRDAIGKLCKSETKKKAKSGWVVL